MAKSLMEGMDGVGTSSKRPAKKNDGGKLIFAVALFLVAGAVFAWYQGWIFASKPPPDMTPQERAEQQKTLETQQKHTQELINKGAAKTGGTS